MQLLLPTAVQLWLSYFLWPSLKETPTTPSLTFSLRHEQAVSDDLRILFSDVPAFLSPTTYAVDTRPVDLHRLSLSAFSNARTRSMRHEPGELIKWDDVTMVGPDVERRETLLQLAKMTFNAYAAGPGKPSEWYELGQEWNMSYPFGWDPGADGFRGQVFVSEDRSTVIVSVKGTSAGWMVGGGGPTTKKDKLNDNLLFSCCCARVGPTWSPVCDCHSGGYTCDQVCLERSLTEDSLFYPTGMNLYNNITYMYPEANIWIIGHSLGGSLASLLGVTFGVPVIAFEAPGEKLAAARLHLPTPPSTQHITHVYHTADPIAMGTCNGVTSTCAMGGYAMETRCHLGKVAVYDTVGRLGWSVDIRLHGIKVVIEQLLQEDWDPEAGREVPPIEPEVDCIDCDDWKFGQFKNMSL